MKKIIVAHRGASAYEKDNSMEAFDKAVKMGVDMIELDLRRTKDNVYIAYHRKIVGCNRIKNLEYSDLNKITGYSVVKMQNLFKKHKKKVKFDIDLKERGYEKDLIKFFNKHIDLKNIIITSRNLDSLKKIKKINPKIKLGISRFLSLPRTIDLCLKNGLEYVVPNHLFLNNKFLDYSYFKKIKVLIYTVNSEKKIKKFLNDSRITGIITNNPEIILNKI